MKKPDLLKEKIKFLEKQLKQKERMITRYRSALDDSNARITKISKHLDENLSLIREVHKNLLPVKLPHIPGFEFSYKFLPTKQGVSGDFFNVIKIEKAGPFGVLLSNCNTYAVTSLFLSSFLKISPQLKRYKTAKDFLSFVAKKISPALKKQDKLHLFYGFISRNSMELDYCLAGNIFVGCKRHEGGKWNILPSSAPYLHKNQIINLKGDKLDLASKDLLLICSPGVLQRENKMGACFGVTNIVKSANQIKSDDVLELRQNILFSCNEFGKGKQQNQDCTVLTIKATGPVLKAQSSP